MSELPPASRRRRASHVGERLAAQLAILSQLSSRKFRSGLNMLRFVSSTYTESDLWAWRSPALRCLWYPAHMLGRRRKRSWKPRRLPNCLRSIPAISCGPIPRTSLAYVGSSNTVENRSRYAALVRRKEKEEKVKKAGCCGWRDSAGRRAKIRHFKLVRPYELQSTRRETFTPLIPTWARSSFST